MANTMKYRGYTARIDFEDEDNIFTGRLLGMAESIVFHGASVEELRADFEFAVDHYLQECARTGRKPEKPAAGRVLLRLPARRLNSAMPGGLQSPWLLQSSPVVQAVPSSHGPVSGAYRHPLAAWQLSCVQTLPSLHLSAW